MQRDAQDRLLSTGGSPAKSWSVALPAAGAAPIARRRIIATLSLTFVLVVSPVRAADADVNAPAQIEGAIASILETRLEGPPPGDTGDLRTYPALQRFYAQRGYRTFRDDVYGRDGLLLKALYGREPRIRQLPQDR